MSAVLYVARLTCTCCHFNCPFKSLNFKLVVFLFLLVFVTYAPAANAIKDEKRLPDKYPDFEDSLPPRSESSSLGSSAGVKDKSRIRRLVSKYKHSDRIVVDNERKSSSVVAKLNDRGEISESRSHAEALSNVNIDDTYEDGDIPDYDPKEEIDAIFNLTSEKGKFLGSPCDFSCDPMLQHVYCNREKRICDCEKQYPVQLGPDKGCAKPKKLGEQCLYRVTCTYADQHSTCTQVQHNAVCECDEGYHRVTISKPNKKVFCGKDLVLIATDLPTLITVASGIAIFTGLICFVLKLFSMNRYARPRHFASSGGPMLFSSDTGIPLTLHGGRPSSRSSQRSSAGTINCVLNRKASSSDGSRGPLVPASRSGSRRPSLASIHSTSSSAKSYSARKLERERSDKEQRQAALQLLQLAKQRDQQQQQQQNSQTNNVPVTPSPRTPHSTDELLPSVEEATEIFYNDHLPSTSDIFTSNLNKIKKRASIITNEMATPLFDDNDLPGTSSNHLY